MWPTFGLLVHVVTFRQACVEALATMLMLRLVPSIYSFTAAIAASLGAWMVAAQPNQTRSVSLPPSVQVTEVDIGNWRWGCCLTCLDIESP